MGPVCGTDQEATRQLPMLAHAMITLIDLPSAEDIVS